MTVHLIVNPNAGKQRGLAIAGHAAAALAAAGMSVVTRVSAIPGQAIDLAADAAHAAGAARTAGQNDAVVAVGGDGTLFEVVNGVRKHCPEGPLPFPLGQIPVGTGNSFIRDLGIAGAEEAIAAIAGGVTRPVDLGTLRCAAGEFSFINLLGAGFVSAVAHGAARYKRWGALSYIIAVLQETARLSPGQFTLTVDGQQIAMEGVFVEICNSRCTGGAMQMAPDALIDDGLLDVVYMERTTRRKLLTLFPRIFSGTHVKDPVIHVVRGREITLETATPWLLTPDGETFGTTPIAVGIRPGAVRMFCP